MDTGLVGVMFSMFSMIAFITSPLNGHLMRRYGRKTILIAGGFIEIFGLVLFGAVYFFSGITFIILSFTARIFQGIGGSALFVSCLSIIANRYPEQIETKLGIIETFGSLGLIVGPLLGVLFYSLGGYIGVFFIYSVVFILFMFLLMHLIPADTCDEQPKDRIQYKDYLKHSEI